MKPTVIVIDTDNVTGIEGLSDQLDPATRHRVVDALQQVADAFGGKARDDSADALREALRALQGKKSFHRAQQALQAFLDE